jgi:hypothetical protein
MKEANVMKKLPDHINVLALRGMVNAIVSTIMS